MKHSEACERNKGPILNILNDIFADRHNVLEIGSGTAQHAVHFGNNLNHLVWQTSDLKENLPDITERIKLEGPDNIKLPLELDVTHRPWNVEAADAIFTANTLHIMPWAYVPDIFEGTGQVLTTNGILCVYGPFNYNGEFTSESNKDFDKWLKNRNPESGIRNFEDVNTLALNQGLKLIKDYSMPANNRLIVWVR